MSGSGAGTSIQNSWKDSRWYRRAEGVEQGRYPVFGFAVACEAADDGFYQRIGAGRTAGQEDFRRLVIGEPVAGIELLFFMKIIMVNLVRGDDIFFRTDEIG